MKVKLTPMKTGSPEPRNPTGVAWMKVATPAAIMAFWMRNSTSACVSEGLAAAATRPIGTMFVTNMASSCCSAKGNARTGLTGP